MLSEETREVAAHISGYNAKKLVEKFGHCCKNHCINDLETASTTHVYIDLLSRGWLYDQNALWLMFVTVLRLLTML